MNLSKAEMMTYDLMNHHGLIEKGWIFQFNNHKEHFGRCHYRERIIEMSRILVYSNGENEVIETILHEIAHALTPYCGHGPLWIQVARDIGSTGNRCYDPKIVNTVSKWVGKCECGKVHKINRKRVGATFTCRESKKQIEFVDNTKKLKLIKLLAELDLDDE